jgi:predicted TIM-barrel fold metal-dependent hydrolase
MEWMHRSFPDQGVPVDVTPDEAVAELRRNGAVRWANLLFPIWENEAVSLHAWGAELAERYPEMTPFGGVLADDTDPLGIVEEAIEHHGMAGLKFHPFVQRTMPWDPRLAPVLDYLERGHKPVYVHTGYERWYGQDFDYASLEGMIEEHPDLPVVLPHIGYPSFEWAYTLAAAHPNVWLDVTNVAGSIILIDPGAPQYRRLADL